MKTIGIVTIDDYSNYGNRLQNYALTKLLEEKGCRVINGIQVNTKQDYIECTSGITKKIVKLLVPYFLLKRRLLPKPISHTGMLKNREVRCIDFMNTYTSVINPIVARNHRHAMNKLSGYGIDYYITGSDQVWNPYFAGYAYQFLAFAPKDKRLSFAASIGVDCIPSFEHIRYRKYLTDMRFLSVRESRAVKIIKEITGRDAELTLDPTLLLEPEKWQEIIRKPNLEIKDEYICTYFLGETPNAVECFSQEKKLPVYALNSENNLTLFSLDPGEFLYMIQNASYVLTDSFHAVAFSIKFNKEFYVFNRNQSESKSMFSRIETITKRFGLDNRIQNREKIIEQSNDIDWERIKEDLEAEKKRSIGKLMEIISR